MKRVVVIVALLAVLVVGGALLAQQKQTEPVVKPKSGTKVTLYSGPATVREWENVTSVSEAGPFVNFYDENGHYFTVQGTIVLERKHFP